MWDLAAIEWIYKSSLWHFLKSKWDKNVKNAHKSVVLTHFWREFATNFAHCLSVYLPISELKLLFRIQGFVLIKFGYKECIILE